MSDKIRKAKLNVELLNYTGEGELTAALAAKLCYSSADIKGLKEKISSEEQKTFIEKIVSIGHHSVLEHVSFTFGIEGVSRALTHQLVRHRIASFSQKSQRYVKHGSDFEYIVPETVESEFAEKYAEMMDQIGSLYDEMVKAGVPAEDARYILPNACETKIIVTMNARELLHYLQIRCCNRAQWEIREMSQRMLELVLDVAPSIFSKAGPGCVFAPCPEGKFTCGKLQEVREKYHKILKLDKF